MKNYQKTCCLSLNCQNPKIAMSNAKTKADRKLKLMADFPRVHEGRFANTHRWSLDPITQ